MILELLYYFSWWRTQPKNFRDERSHRDLSSGNGLMYVSSLSSGYMCTKAQYTVLRCTQEWLIRSPHPASENYYYPSCNDAPSVMIATTCALSLALSAPSPSESPHVMNYAVLKGLTQGYSFTRGMISSSILMCSAVGGRVTSSTVTRMSGLSHCESCWSLCL